MELEDIAGQSVVLKFTATWCGPCQALAPIVDRVSHDMNIKVIAVDIDDEPEITAQLGVRGVPTMMAWNGERFVDQLVGAHSEASVRKFFELLKEDK